MGVTRESNTDMTDLQHKLVQLQIEMMENELQQIEILKRIQKETAVTCNQTSQSRSELALVESIKYLAKCDKIPFCKKSANLESNNTNNGSNFANMPSEIILTVFNHLNQSDLARCARVCRRFRDLTTADCLWMGKAKESLATNCQDSEMKSKSVQPWISAQDRVRIFDTVIFFMLLYSIFMELQCLLKKTRFFLAIY